MAWVDRYLPRPTATVSQGAHTLASKRLWWPAAPGRAFRIPSALLRGANPDGGPVHISIR